MPPTDTSAQSRERYFLRILAALARERGGELRIKQCLIDEVNGAGARQALFEDFDTKKQEIVLRFGSKHSAIYPFEAESCPVPKAESKQEKMPSQPQSLFRENANEPSPRVRKPLSDSEVAQMEKKAKQILAAARIRNERRTSYVP